MSAPLSHHDPSSPPGAAFAEKSARERVALARKWAYLVSKTAYLPLSPTELEQHLLQLIDQLFEAVRSEPFEADLAAVVGDRLVELRCVGRDSLRRTMEILGKALLHQPELRGVGRLAERAVLVLGVMMSSYNETLRQVAQKRHENLYQALLKVTRDSQQEQLISEAQFDEVFAYSKSGLAITGLDGRFLRTNVALNKTLGYSATEIAELTLFDVIDPDQMATLRAAYQDLIDGKVERFGHEHQLVCKNGKTVWTFVAGSLVRDAGDKAQHVVTIIENDTDLSLLQKRLSYQSLHDALTGLPNRQFFSTRLESVLRHADPRTGITLYHLDLDSFSLIIGGLGYDMGERLLKSVANRLVAVVADEKAIVARLGPDDFGILVENTSTTPDVGTMVDRINQELSEPVYFDGQHGVAASVSIGVV
ncbi:MAG: diguanylate cyclase domain-containing protein, partial [Candidatus Dormibacteraceae bacterium]